MSFPFPSLETMSAALIRSIVGTRQGRQLAMQGPWWSTRTRIREAVQIEQGRTHHEPGWAESTLPDLFAELGRAGETPELGHAGQAWVEAYERLVRACKSAHDAGAPGDSIDSPLDRALHRLLELLDSPEGVHAWNARKLVNLMHSDADILSIPTDERERAAAEAQARRARGSAGGIAAWEHPADED